MNIQKDIVEKIESRNGKLAPIILDFISEIDSEYSTQRAIKQNLIYRLNELAAEEKNEN